MRLRFLQLQNASVPISRTLAGTVTLSASQPQNQRLPIFSTPSGMVMSFCYLRSQTLTPPTSVSSGGPTLT